MSSLRIPDFQSGSINAAELMEKRLAVAKLERRLLLCLRAMAPRDRSDESRLVEKELVSKWQSAHTTSTA